ncbi:GGDEF domain-containing protein [Sulfurimonas sp.]
MFESEWLSYYLYASLAILLVSLYFNYKFMKELKRRQESEAVLIKNAYFNPVTELPNRENINIVLSEQIDRSFRHRRTFLLTIIKIKNYHDVHLHSKDVGDAFIREASERILENIRSEDALAHITDDGFVIVFNEYLDENNYDIIIHRIRKAFEEKPHINTKYNIKFEILVGHSKYPDDGTDENILIERATQSALKL